MSDPSPSPPVPEASDVLTRLQQLPRRDWSDYESSPTPKRTKAMLMVWAVLSSGGFCASWVMSYFSGYYGAGSEPLINLSILAAMLCGLLVLICTIIAIVRRHHIRFSLLTLLAVGLVWLSSGFLLPHSFLFGLKRRMLNAMTPDQMRVAAVKVRELMGSQGYLRGPGKLRGLSRPEDARIWAELSALPGMANLGDSISVSSSEEEVSFYWDLGGWNIDWGVRINPAGVHRLEEDTYFSAWQPDIGFYYANR